MGSQYDNLMTTACLTETSQLIMVYYKHFVSTFLCKINHTRLTKYYMRHFVGAIINISLRFSQCYFTKYVGYNTNCIGAVTKSNQMGANTVRIVTLIKL